jgi:hypothetical protein
MQLVKNLIDTYMQSTISQIHQGIKSIKHKFQVSRKETEERREAEEKGNKVEEKGNIHQLREDRRRPASGRSWSCVRDSA